MLSQHFDSNDPCAVVVDTSLRQEEAFKASFRIRRRLQRALIVPAIAAFLASLVEAHESFLLAARLGLPSWVVHMIAILVIAGSLVAASLIWRCPSCRRFLGLEFSPSYCRRCGCPFD
jgi:hypothetical protein